MLLMMGNNFEIREIETLSRQTKSLQVVVAEPLPQWLSEQTLKL